MCPDPCGVARWPQRPKGSPGSSTCLSQAHCSGCGDHEPWTETPPAHRSALVGPVDNCHCFICHLPKTSRVPSGSQRNRRCLLINTGRERWAPEELTCLSPAPCPLRAEGLQLSATSSLPLLSTGLLGGCEGTQQWAAFPCGSPRSRAAGGRGDTSEHPHVSLVRAQRGEVTKLQVELHLGLGL